MSDLRSCADYEADLSALLDGELADERAGEVRAHVAVCRRCAPRLEALQGVDRLLASAPAPGVPSDLRARLAARVAADARREPGRRRPSRRRRFVAPALGLAAGAAAALALYLSVPGGEAPREEAAPPSRMAGEAPEATIDLDDVPAEELAIALEIDTIEDLEVIANLDLLVRLAAAEGGAG
jgi:anti-sigma factor (TIGR02949 family)